MTNFGSGPGDERQQAAEQMRAAAELFERGSIKDATVPAKAAAELIRSALRKTPSDAREFDAVVGEFGQIAGSVCLILLHSGDLSDAAEARRILQESFQETTRHDGPLTRRGRAAVLFVVTSNAVDQAMDAITNGRVPPVQPAELIHLVRELVQLQREVATLQEEMTFLNLGQGLRMLGRVAAAAGHGSLAADSYAEAWSILSGFTGPGAEHLTTLILTEMNALSSAFPGVDMVAGMPGTWKGPTGADRYQPLSG
jgi:hypothetical protein